MLMTRRKWMATEANVAAQIYTMWKERQVMKEKYIHIAFKCRNSISKAKTQN